MSDTVRDIEKGQMMNNLMFYPFVTGSISVIFARYKRAVPDERDATDRGGSMVSCVIPRARDRCQMPKNTRQKHYNIIISMIYGAAPFLNGQHLSSNTDDAGYPLSFDFPAAFSLVES